MRNTLIIAVLALSIPSISVAELQGASFNYSYIQGTYSLVAIETDYSTDLEGSEFGVTLSKELDDKIFVELSYIYSNLDDTIRFNDIDATASIEGSGYEAAVAFGKAWGLSERSDIYTLAGFGVSGGNVEVTAESNGVEAYSAEEEDTDTDMFIAAGLKIFLDTDRHVEINPEFSIGNSGGETSKKAQIIASFHINQQVDIGVGASIYLDDDISMMGVGLNYYY